jgi:DNA-binding NarL/FixJ family response regulator
MVQKTTILIVDDHTLFREGLKAILAQESQYEVIGETGNGHEALKLAQDLKPDLILLDMALPDRNGIELTREIRHRLPEVRVIIVSMHSKVDYIVQAFEAGATGYVVKESAFERLLQGIECVLNGESFMDSSVSHKVVEKLMRLPDKETKIRDAKYDSLTLREQEVMVLLAEGFSVKQIADKLFISPKTADNHRHSIMRKLDIHSPFELVRYAVKLGLIDLELWKD